MADSRLPARDRELFLAEPHVAALSVPAEGPVTRMVTGTDELPRQVTVRYLPPEKVPAYLAFAAGPGGHVAIYLRPRRWLSADLGPG